MKLNKDYISHWSGEEQVIVATGESADKFCGIFKGNKTTAMIIDYFKEDVTRDFVIADILSKYTVEASIVEKDVDLVIAKLQEIGALDEA